MVRDFTRVDPRFARGNRLRDLRLKGRGRLSWRPSFVTAPLAVWSAARRKETGPASHSAAQRHQLGRDPRDLALVSSASPVHAAASSAQGSKGPSASRRQWSACVLYVSASSSKRSASIWFMTEVSQR